jgi:hypothetical protein
VQTEKSEDKQGRWEHGEGQLAHRLWGRYRIRNISIRLPAMQGRMVFFKPGAHSKTYVAIAQQFFTLLSVHLQ